MVLPPQHTFQTWALGVLRVSPALMPAWILVFLLRALSSQLKTSDTLSFQEGFGVGDRLPQSSAFEVGAASLCMV